jgi:LacI family transcriptional regulator
MSNTRSSLKNAKATGPVTIEMVAQLAGVSLSTVSRILNGTAVVSDAKKQAVDRAIAELDFVPNPMARSLAGGRSHSIGVITRAIDSPFYGAALRGIEETLDPAGYSSLFVSGHFDVNLEKRCFDLLRGRRVDGIIVLTGHLPDSNLKTYAKNLPLVVTGRTLKAKGLVSLDFDNFEGGRLATEHLLSLGHQKIAVISGEASHKDSTERLRGHCAALAAAGLPFDPRLVVAGDYLELGGVRAVEKLLAQKSPFTGIFALNDQMAAGAALALHRLGKHIPSDYSLVGFDDLPQSVYASPPLTTVRQPAYELGELAAECMIQLLKGESPSVTPPGPSLIIRESTRALERR